MNERDFCFWLQGFFEISGAKELTPDQVEMIRNHLNLVKECRKPIMVKPAGNYPHNPGEVTLRC